MKVFGGGRRDGLKPLGRIVALPEICLPALPPIPTTGFQDAGNGTTVYFFLSHKSENRLYFHEISAHTSVSKLSEPLGLVAESPRQVVLSA